MTTTKETIIDYYDSCEIDYRLFWDLNTSMAMHAGYWDSTTKTLRDALKRENEVLAEMAAIKSTDRVLDAGCGVGGSSLFLAKTIGCQTTGITLSKKQAQTAAQKAAKQQLSSKCNFQVMDFCNTTFANNTFDVVWAIESFCHAPCKESVVREAFRVLKPGGRLIVADGFQLKPHLNDAEHISMQTWIRGWGCDHLESVESFEGALKKAHFEAIRFVDITSNVMPSSKRLYYISIPALVLSKIGEWLRLRTKIQTENIRAAYAQYHTLKKQIWHYGIFTAVKKVD